ncbi:MAG: hypothetical protein EU532_07785 [Promethearchaeota archaeon]|nr:MAG: hypothetical protein EU532_07785 [Candidatus Lokiarchaeota archaeon]
MPVGLAIMKWDPRIGTQIVAKYPEEIKVSDATLMQIYSTHEYSGEAGMISLMVGPLNIASYFTGPDKGYYIILLLTLDDDPDSFEGGLSDVSRIILQNIDDNAFVPMIPSLFRRLSVYPTLNQEQLLAITYQDEVKRMIINRLRDEGVVSKSELSVWLKDKYRYGFFDIDAILFDLVKREIIKEASVKDMPSELIFLINDLLILRIPPTKVLTDPVERGLPENLVNDYRVTVRKFFEGYTPSEEDSHKLIDLIVNPNIYDTIKLLRTTVATKNVLEKLRKKGVDDIDGVLKELWENKIINVFRDKRGIEYYAMLSDFCVTLMYPKYLLSTVIQEYEVKSKTDKVLIEYLNVLEDAYYEHKIKMKSTKKEIEAEE